MVAFSSGSHSVRLLVRLLFADLEDHFSALRSHLTSCQVLFVREISAALLDEKVPVAPQSTMSG